MPITVRCLYSIPVSHIKLHSCNAIILNRIKLGFKKFNYLEGHDPFSINFRHGRYIRKYILITFYAAESLFGLPIKVVIEFLLIRYRELDYLSGILLV